MTDDGVTTEIYTNTNVNYDINATSRIFGQYSPAKEMTSYQDIKCPHENTSDAFFVRSKSASIGRQARSFIYYKMAEGIRTYWPMFLVPIGLAGIIYCHDKEAQYQDIKLCVYEQFSS